MAVVGNMGTPLPDTSGNPSSPLEISSSSGGSGNPASKPTTTAPPATLLGIPLDPIVIGLIVANIASSVSLVGVNKHLVVSYGFKYVLLLSALHFLVGYLFLHFTSDPKWGTSRLFTRKDLPLKIVLPVAVAGMGSVVLMNYSLRFNSTSSYQLMKVAVLPATVGLSALAGTSLTRVDIGCAVLVTVGTAIATVTDLSLTLAGTMIGVVAVLATAQYQVLQGTIQKQNDIGSTAALHCISLPQAVLTFACSLMFETTWSRVLGPVVCGTQSQTTPLQESALVKSGGIRVASSSSLPSSSSTPIASSVVVPHSEDIWTHGYDLAEVALILLTCGCAVVLNYTGISLIKHLSSIGFQMVNQTKTVLTLSLGFLLFAEATSVSRLVSLGVGLSLVLLGVGWYTVNKSKR